jgi:uncharacterized membrane protein YhhN
LWLAFSVSVAVYAVLSVVGVDPLVLKPVPVASLAVLVAIRSRATGGEGRAARVIAGALAIDAVADGVIEVSFLGGLAVFLLGHLARIAGFTLDRPRVAAARAVPFAVVVVGIGGPVALTAGPLGAPIALYALAIGAMGWRAAARVDGTRARALGLAGAVLYVLSDTLLAANKFATPLPAAQLLILGTYWGAQALIARSMLG